MVHVETGCPLWKCLRKTWKYICIFCRSMTLRWHWLLIPFHMVDNISFNPFANILGAVRLATQRPRILPLVVLAFFPYFMLLVSYNDNIILGCYSNLTLNVWGPNYLGLTRSISWLLMPWLLTSPGHQQPWYWLCRIGRFLSCVRKDFNYLRRIKVAIWHKMLIYVNVLSEKFST